MGETRVSIANSWEYAGTIYQLARPAAIARRVSLSIKVSQTSRRGLDVLSGRSELLVVAHTNSCEKLSMANS